MSHGRETNEFILIMDKGHRRRRRRRRDDDDDDDDDDDIAVLNYRKLFHFIRSVIASEVDT
jgi:hypothetical protein